MIDKLKELLNNSYAPISNFPVSSCVVMNDGNMFYGVNVEDASTRAGTCAERNAIFSAITQGYKKGDFKEIHVMVGSGNVGTPCFVCRQMLLEVFDLDSLVYCYSTNGQEKKYTIRELCPHPFGEDDLK
ncbi:MAG: cytidine deaminase [Bacilli bacterium]|nr:cytidine deaminase [Bacilli bacterium]